MTEHQIKAAVRKRDNFRCVECGFTNDQNKFFFKKQLEVHRKDPGAPYSIEGCVTLCRLCHAQKGKSPLRFKWTKKKDYPCQTSIPLDLKTIVALVDASGSILRPTELMRMLIIIGLRLFTGELRTRIAIASTSRRMNDLDYISMVLAERMDQDGIPHQPKPRKPKRDG